MRVLCLSPDESFASEICAEAAEQNWSAVHVRGPDEADRAMEQANPDIMFVDLSSQQVLSQIEERGWATRRPTYVLHADFDEELLIRALECGADGFLPRQAFTRRLFVARVNAFLRRQGLMGERRIVPRLQMTFDSQRNKVDVAGIQVGLTQTEFKILNLLATEEDTVVSRPSLQTAVFGGAQISRRSLDVHVCALRKKLKPFQLDIESSRGVGYRLGPCSPRG